VRVSRCPFAFALAAAGLLRASTALAQQAPLSDVPDRFRLEAGGFRIGAHTELTFSTSGGPRPPADFESLSLPESATHLYFEGFWRPWRRHHFSLSWYRNNREGDPRTIESDVTWGDRVIHPGASLTGRVSSNYLSGVYRFAAYKNDRFEIGPSLGIGRLSIEAKLRGQGSSTTPGGTVSGPFDVSKSLGQPTGDLGGYFYWWTLRRLLLRGDLRYIVVKPGNSEASITDGRAAALYYPWRRFGVGLQYNYNRFRYDREILSTELGGRLRYSGGQVLIGYAF